LNPQLAFIALSLILVAPAFAQPAADSDGKLASDFWAWRARYAQYTSDDIPRMERPTRHDPRLVARQL
jgi:hypothetical protein